MHFEIGAKSFIFLRTRSAYCEFETLLLCSHRATSDEASQTEKHEAVFPSWKKLLFIARFVRTGMGRYPVGLFVCSISCLRAVTGT